MVRDATVSPTPDTKPQSTTSSGEASAATTTSTSATGATPTLNSQDVASRLDEAEPLQEIQGKSLKKVTGNLERGGNQGDTVRTLKAESSDVSVETHLLTEKLNLPTAECKNAAEFSSSVSSHLVTDLRKKDPVFLQKGKNGASDSVSVNSLEQQESVSVKTERDTCDSSLKGSNCAEKGSRLWSEQEKRVVKTEGGYDTAAAAREEKDSLGGAGVVFNVVEGLQKRLLADRGAGQDDGVTREEAEPVVKFDGQKRLGDSAACNPAAGGDGGKFKVSMKSAQWKETSSSDGVLSSRTCDSKELKSGPIQGTDCLLYTSPSPRDMTISRMPSSA